MASYSLMTGWVERLSLTRGEMPIAAPGPSNSHRLVFVGKLDGPLTVRVWYRFGGGIELLEPDFKLYPFYSASEQEIACPLGWWHRGTAYRFRISSDSRFSVSKLFIETHQIRSGAGQARRR